MVCSQLEVECSLDYWVLVPLLRHATTSLYHFLHWISLPGQFHGANRIGASWKLEKVSDTFSV